MKNLEVLKVPDEESLKQCLKVREEVFVVEKGVPKEIEVDGYDCLDKMCDHFLIKYQNSNVGTIRCLHTTGDSIRVQRFCFLKGQRGLGFGKAVMKYIENYYKERGIKTIEMDAKYEVHGFYEKCGYRKNSEVFLEVNIEHIKMIKNF